MESVHAAKAQLRPVRQPDRWPRIADFPPSAAAAAASDPRDGGCLPAPAVAVLEDAAAATAAEFRAEFEAPSAPGVLRGLVDGWAAADLTKPRGWSIASLLARLGGHIVQCGDDAEGENVELPFDAYVLDYLRSCPDRNPMLVFDSVILEPFALQQQQQQQQQRGRPEPEPEPEPDSADLCDDYSVPAIFSEDDYLSELGPLARPPYRWVLIAPARSGSFVHTDPMGTSSRQPAPANIPAFIQKQRLLLCLKCALRSRHARLERPPRRRETLGALKPAIFHWKNADINAVYPG